MMPRQMLRNTLAAVLIGLAAASSATAQDIVVTGPGERVVDRTSFGADVVEYSASLIVNVRDLDLASAEGWSAMERRLATASHNACNLLDERIPFDLRQNQVECESTAYRRAITRFRQ